MYGNVALEATRDSWHSEFVFVKQQCNLLNMLKYVQNIFAIAFDANDVVCVCVCVFFVFNNLNVKPRKYTKMHNKYYQK